MHFEFEIVQLGPKNGITTLLAFGSFYALICDLSSDISFEEHNLDPLGSYCDTNHFTNLPLITLHQRTVE